MDAGNVKNMRYRIVEDVLSIVLYKLLPEPSQFQELLLIMNPIRANKEKSKIRKNMQKVKIAFKTRKRRGNAQCPVYVAEDDNVVFLSICYFHSLRSSCLIHDYRRLA